MPPTSTLPDTQTLVLRFLEALGTAETSLSSLSDSLSRLDQVTQILASTTPQLAELSSLPVELVQASDRLAKTLQPSTRRIWLQAASISIAACLLTLVTLTCIRPQWMLTPDLGRQLRLGQSIERRFQELTPTRRSQLLELLDPASTRSLSSKP